MLIKIAICDDMRQHISLLKSIIKELDTSFSDIDTFTDPKELIYNIQNGNKYSLLFLDIGMEPINGIEVAKIIRKTDKNMLIVFITSIQEYMQIGYEVQAFRYIMKPINKPKIEKLLISVKDVLIPKNEKVYTIVSNGDELTFPLDEILYFEALGRKTILKTLYGEFDFYARVKDIEVDLKDDGFILCHRSFLANIKKSKRIEKLKLILINNEEIVISRNFRKNTHEYFYKYLGE